MSEFNAAQKVVLQSYCDGEYAHLTDMASVNNSSDGLFKFLMSETSDEEGCEDIVHALRRLVRVRLDTARVHDTLRQAWLMSEAA